MRAGASCDVEENPSCVFQYISSQWHKQSFILKEWPIEKSLRTTALTAAPHCFYHSHPSSVSLFSAKQLVRGEPNVSYICSRYYRAPELIFGATDYTSNIGECLTPPLHLASLWGSDASAE